LGAEISPTGLFLIHGSCGLNKGGQVKNPHKTSLTARYESRDFKLKISLETKIGNKN